MSDCNIRTVVTDNKDVLISPTAAKKHAQIPGCRKPLYSGEMLGGFREITPVSVTYHTKRHEVIEVLIFDSKIYVVICDTARVFLGRSIKELLRVAEINDLEDITHTSDILLSDSAVSSGWVKCDLDGDFNIWDILSSNEPTKFVRFRKKTEDPLLPFKLTQEFTVSDELDNVSEFEYRNLGGHMMVFESVLIFQGNPSVFYKDPIFNAALENIIGGCGTRQLSLIADCSNGYLDGMVDVWVKLFPLSMHSEIKDIFKHRNISDVSASHTKTSGLRLGGPIQKVRYCPWHRAKYSYDMETLNRLWEMLSRDEGWENMVEDQYVIRISLLERFGDHYNKTDNRFY